MKSTWLSLGCFVLISGAALSSCDSLPEGFGPSASAVSAADAAKASASDEETTPALKHIVDISGCWRPVGESLVYSDGGSFTIFAIANNMFIMGKNARTRFEIKEDFRFTEGNRDPQKPFFPPGYVHSTGIVSEDGLAISRSLVGQSGTKEYRRCANVVQAPPGLRQPVQAVDPNKKPETDEPGATPSPEGTIAPLMSRLNAPLSPTPVASEPPPEPTPEASAP